ncbi:MAG: class I adenylate-forming enzyme family protein [Dehalococcoidales bacterium]|jgi:acyl-CoA synthetase (AMP-forming)/AMP-acid ligase II|nr:class I adenylate-forming enzyme family protein [Dehalococcoidales bacterium]MDD4465541.1 class I adenylate-forming enzyme family protein [Dehalococcoidales bacterium]
MTILDLVSRNAELYPADTALIELKPSTAYRRAVTWSEFNESINRLATALVARGIGREDKVIHLMMNSIDWLICYFAILKTGAWAVPLNFRFTSRDILYCANISEASTIILGPEFVGRVEEAKSGLNRIKHYIYTGIDAQTGMDNLNTLITSYKPNAREISFNQNDVCGLYFTSGTTGDPKPIVLTHKNMMHAAVTEQKHHHQTKEDNFILLPPLYHTGAKMHWFGSLYSGSKATILTEIKPKNILDALHSERGTIIWLLVPWAQDILGELDRGELKLADYDLSNLRLMHIGAQPVPPSLVKRWKAYFPGVAYDTNYGLSESTGPGCVHLGLENEHKVGAIGKAGEGWSTRIVDESGRDAAPGKVGELLVKGNGVMKEYYKNPAKTAEAIRDGWLYTGDMAKTDEDGFIYLVDRKKDVIITGGENIFPVEIEEALSAHPGVYDVAAIGVKDERLGEIVAVVIDPQPGTKLTQEEIANYCEKTLPRYKRPRLIFFDKVPRNPTGKIEKPVLREKYSG